jgi:cytochrome b6-f complex iron-sulfur subunit
MDRRRLLRLASFGTLGLLAGAGGIWTLGAGRREALPVLLGRLEQFPLGSILLFEQHGVLVRRDERGLAFISTRCTHMGCRVQLAGDELVCPCHRGRFTLDGTVISGPPPAPLPWLEGEVSARGEVYVYPERALPARRRLT